jgi:hypothetical protein
MIRVGRSIEKIFLSSGFLTFQYDSRNHLLREWWPCGTDTDTRAAAEPTRVDGDGDGDRDRDRAMRRAMRAHVVAPRFVRSRAVRCEESRSRVASASASASRRRRDDPPPS